MTPLLLPFCCFLSISMFSQSPLLTNIPNRNKISLNSRWQYIMDPYETGFYNYRWQERAATDREAYWNSDIPANKSDRKEHGYSIKYTLNVPGDWNSQHAKFLYYEGTTWYKRNFDITLPGDNETAFFYFGAVNYRADVYLNGQKLGMHKGGFTPFNFEIPHGLLKEKNNFLVVKVDNKRYKEEIPTLNTDWWNYGGITRDVYFIKLPKSHIRDYSVQLAPQSSDATPVIEGWIKLSQTGIEAIIEIPELKVRQRLTVTADSVPFRFNVPGIRKWSPSDPKLYNVIIKYGADRINEKIGFRSIAVSGKQILLNGKPIFLRGICIHEEIPEETRRAHSKKDALNLLTKAKQLNANMVRLAHYPHNENMTRLADSLGILVWSEIPVYWTIDFTSDEVLTKAKSQLHEMITRDRNRASIIIWSVGNETPVSETRTRFMSELVKTAKRWDSSRLVSAALEVHNINGVFTIDDPLGHHTDIVAVNEYLGWYTGLPDACRTAQWEVKYDKPLFFSETGAEAAPGYHADSLTRWSEEYQEWYFREQVAMMKRMPSNYIGMAPWILNDFRSPRRNNPVYQEGWNNKGLFDQHGKKKKAFFIMKTYYDEMELKYR